MARRLPVSAFWLLGAFLLSGVIIGCSSNSGSSSSALPNATSPNDQNAQPNYGVPYTRPTTQSVVDALGRLRKRLDRGTVLKVVTTRNLRATTNPSEPAMTEALDRGPEKKFDMLSYPMGVVYAGMLSAADATGDPAFNDFVATRFQFYHDGIAGKDPAAMGRALRTSAFHNLLAPDSLDACGAVGSSIVKARLAGVGPDMNDVIQRFATYISTGQFRLDDGTLARKSPFPQSIWADDEYMSVPFLSQMGKMTGDVKYFDDAAKQIEQIGGRLYQTNTMLFTHHWSGADPDFQPIYYWGRANGWMFMAAAELLDNMPQDHPRREAILKIFRQQAKGLANAQAGDGLWHQLLDRTDSYTETSASAMFTYAFARGVDKGWLDMNSYGPVAISGWNGLTTRINKDGTISQVCIGTGYGDDYVFYYHRPAIDDVHGYGPLLLAGAEMVRFLKNPLLAISGDSRGGAVVVDHPKANNNRGGNRGGGGRTRRGGAPATAP